MGGLPLALTMGEPAGIGGEIALKAWLERTRRGLPDFFLIDDPKRLAVLAKSLEWQVPIREIQGPEEVSGVVGNALPVLPLEYAVDSVPGKLDSSNAQAVLTSIAKAVDLVASRKAAAVVTNPIHKAVLQQAGFKHPGHTEYLAELAGGGAVPVMMLTGADLRVVPITIHMAIADVPKHLGKNAIIEQGLVLNTALKRDFAIPAPRIAVAGLNPHAGEEGVMGREEMEIISPAIAKLRERGVNAFGPLPADTLFHAEARKTYDAVLCMYHDQALIPVKMLGFWDGVNVTLGLPFVRTSPDHGTALSLAGTGRADAGSLMAALKLARRMADARAAAA